MDRSHPRPILPRTISHSVAFALLAWLCLPACPAAVAAGPGAGRLASVAEAKQFFDAGRYGEAAGICDRVLSANASTAEAYYVRGECRRKTWWLDKAADDYSQAIRFSPSHAPAHFARGLIREYQGDWDKALVDYDTATRLDPNLALPYVYRGGIRWRRGQIEAAKADLSRGIELCSRSLRDNADDLQAYRTRALAYRTLKDYDRAIDDYSQMIRLAPGSVEAYVERGRTRAQKEERPAAAGDLNQAVELATAAIQRQPDELQPYRLRVDAYDAKAFAWRNPDDFRRAVADLDTILAKAPDCSTACFRRGHLHAAASFFAGDPEDSQALFEQAEADLGRALRLAPAYPAAWEERGLLYTRSALRTHQVTTAQRGVADLSEMLRLTPKAARAYCARGSAYGLAGDLKRAVADFDEAIRLCPELADAHELRGTLNMALGNQEAAQTDLARAQELRKRTR